MIHDYLKAGYPALYLITQEPNRAEQVIPCEGWRFYSRNCIAGRDHQSSNGTPSDQSWESIYSWLKIINVINWLTVIKE
ncbi:MAG: hypothetical protein HQK77_04730 [Desulfobacterales bacterium]|nr:hypothetical protein [Desulfobacterales bacterium]